MLKNNGNLKSEKQMAMTRCEDLLTLGLFHFYVDRRVTLHLP